MNKRDMQKIPELIGLLAKVTDLLLLKKTDTAEYRKLRRMIKTRLKFFSKTNMISPVEYTATSLLVASATSREIANDLGLHQKKVKSILIGMTVRLNELYDQYEVYKLTSNKNVWPNKNSQSRR
jgi:FixJ family two-component response regulator